MSIFHSLHIEIQKSKRTKSFFIVFFLMIIATVWNLACTVAMDSWKSLQHPNSGCIAFANGHQCLCV